MQIVYRNVKCNIDHVASESFSIESVISGGLGKMCICKMFAGNVIEEDNPFQMCSAEGL